MLHNIHIAGIYILNEKTFIMLSGTIAFRSTEVLVLPGAIGTVFAESGWLTTAFNRMEVC